jgi:hypothetical protein
MKPTTLFPIRRRLYAATILSLLLLFSGVADAEIIPASRLAPWQGNVGVPGGIPVRTTIYKNIVTDLGADPTGATDCSAIIQSALTTCPQNQIVYIPEGTFRISAFIHQEYATSSNKTVRGAGMGQTILKLDDGVNSVFNIGTSPGNTIHTHSISAGATKNSNTVTVDNASDFTVGSLMTINTATPTWAHIIGWQDFTANRIITATFKVRSKTSTTVTFDPPCPFDFSGMSPNAIAEDIPNSAFLPVTGFGIEDLTFDLSANQSGFCAVQFFRTWGCWMKNTEIKGAVSRSVYNTNAVRCEFRGVYHHDIQGSGPGHEGLDFVTGCSWNLVEDGIFGPHGGGPPVILGDGGGGCVANVIGYNYFFGNGAIYDISLNHGTHNMLNLVEGNVYQSQNDDGYFGSCSHNTLFRNKITDQLRLKHMTTYYSIVGCVLGRGTQTLYDTEVNNYWQVGFPFYELGYPNAGNAQYGHDPAHADVFIEATDPPDYSSEPWHLSDGWPINGGAEITQCGDPALPYDSSVGCDSVNCATCLGMQELDRNVKATLIRHGNFDTVHNGVVWDQSISDHTIPNSLYYSSTPVWWPDGVAWPPIGPDRDPMASEIPAQIRYASMQNPPPRPPGGLRILP